MLVTSEGNISVLTQEKRSLAQFIEGFKEALPGLKNQHLILNLLSLEAFDENDLLEFLDFSRAHKQAAKSFVLVAKGVDLDDLHMELSVVPTLQEAYDVIQLEEIERDLDF